jgi:hypothetical protein
MFESCRPSQGSPIHLPALATLSRSSFAHDYVHSQPVELQREGFILESAEYRQVASLHRKPTMRV